MNIDGSDISTVLMRPEFLALVALIGGFIIARATGAAVSSLLNAVGRRAARLTTTEESLVTPRLVRVTRTVVFWLLFALAVVIALQVLGVAAIAQLLAIAVALIPSVLVAFAIVVTGHLLGLLSSQVVTRVFDGIHADSLLPRLLHVAIVAVAIVMALQQLGVDISFVTQLFLIVIGIVGGGFMLSFALGARQHVSNLLARRELERLAVGDRIRIGDVEGTVVAIHSTAVEVGTAHGVTSIPAAQFAERMVTRLTGDDRNA